MATHSLLTGSQLHEPKGVESAATNDAYIANGDSTSGTWKEVPVVEDGAANSIFVANGTSGSWTVQNNLNKVYLSVDIDDLSTAASLFKVLPLAGDISNIWCVIDQAIAGADTVLTFEIGGVAITGSTITITQAGSAAGDVDTATPTGSNTVTAGQALEVICDGGTTTTNAKARLTIELDVS